jgi:uncharacterized protein (TIGR02001 family)
VRPETAIRVWILACALLGAGAHRASAEEQPRWQAPFGGTFNAQFTVASEYTQNGISNTQRQPAFQAALDYKSANITTDIPSWAYLTLFGSTIHFIGFNPGVEFQVQSGVKARFLDRKLGVDVGYIRYFYPDIPATQGYDYGEINLAVGYDFGAVTIGGRLRYSPDTINNAGPSWNKRAIVSAPLDFLKTDTFAFKAYGSLGNYWVDRYQVLNLPTDHYWYWQVGVVASAWGFDLTLAYTDTNLNIADCNNTTSCAARAFVSLTKTF